jgi:hypothetical protein
VGDRPPIVYKFTGKNKGITDPMRTKTVIPAQAGIQSLSALNVVMQLIMFTYLLLMFA